MLTEIKQYNKMSLKSLNPNMIQHILSQLSLQKEYKISSTKWKQGTEWDRKVCTERRSSTVKNTLVNCSCLIKIYKTNSVPISFTFSKNYLKLNKYSS